MQESLQSGMAKLATTGASLALGLLLLLPYTGGYLSGLSAAIIGAAVLVLAVLISAGVDRAVLRQMADLFGNKLMLAVLAMIAVKTLHDSFHFQEALGFRMVVQHVVWTVLYSALAIWIVALGRGEGVAALFVLAVGVAIYLAANIVGYQLGLKEHVVVTGSIKALETTDLSERMIAPFGPGLNNFGCIAAFGTQAGILLLNAARRLKSLELLLCSGLVVSVGLFSLYLVQIRSGLVGIFFAVALLLLGVKGRKFAAFAVLVGMLALPAMCYRLAAVDWIEKLVPEGLDTVLARNETELFQLGGRVFVYDYGWELLGNGQVGWLGVGQVARDSSPAVDDLASNVNASTFSFHNGAMEFLIVYGPIMGLWLWMMMGLPIILVRTSRHSGRQFSQSVSWALLASLFISAYFEAFPNLWFFWMSFLLCVAMVTAFPDPKVTDRDLKVE